MIVAKTFANSTNSNDAEASG